MSGTTIIGSGNTDIFYIQDTGGGTIQYKKNSGGTWSNITSWPVNVSNTSTSNYLPVIFNTNCVLSGGTSNYFNCASQRLQFGSQTLNSNGTVTVFTINGITNYLGLINNLNSGTGTGYPNISIYNIQVVASNGSTLASGGGWIGQTTFANSASNNLIVNCSSTGTITGTSGGILGQSSGYNSATITIRGCYSTGDIGSSGGGIVGQSCAVNSGVINIDRCWSSGSIGTNAGGMTGNSCGIQGGSINATNCYSTGTIGINAGGIFGITNGYSTGTPSTASATNCYSTGNINSGGGIFGANAGTGGFGQAIATNCYSTGNITNGGGIYGTTAATTTIATRCYTSGAVSPNGGIWISSSSSTFSGSTNNYAEGNNSSSGWNDTNARSVLTGLPGTYQYGTTWSKSSATINTPFILTNSGYSPYSLVLSNAVSASLTGGDPTSTAIVPGYTHTLLNSADPAISPYFTVNSSTGAITTSTSTPTGTYTLYIYSISNPYSITVYTLSVTQYVAPAVTTTTVVSCCQIPLDLKNTDYEQRNKIIGGNVVIAETAPRRQAYTSYADLLYKKIAYASKRS